MAKVELDMSEFQDMLKKQRDLEQELNRLKAELVKNQIGGEERLPLAVAALESASKVIGFAIGNWHYDDVKGWPWLELSRMCDIFLGLPGITEDDRSWIEDALSFAKGARLREEERATRQPGDQPKPLKF